MVIWERLGSQFLRISGLRFSCRNERRQGCRGPLKKLTVPAAKEHQHRDRVRWLLNMEDGEQAGPMTVAIAMKRK